MTDHEPPSSTNPSEIAALIARLKHGSLNNQDTLLVERLLRLLLTLIRVVEHKNTSISRLKRLLFSPGADTRAARSSIASAAPLTKDEPQASDQASAALAPGAPPPPIEEHAPRRGHTRHAAAQYTGARRVVCADPALSAGDECPSRACRAHLYDTKSPAIFIRLEGRPLISATRYEQQVLRCSTCAERFTAPLPAGVPAEKYDPTADVAIALYKYGAGMPFYRQARLQQMCGVPIAESVQYARCVRVAECVRPVYEEMVRAAARADVLYTDDTRLVMLDLLKENKQLPVGARRAVQTSGMVAKVGAQQIALYLSGRRHAGENTSAL